jgi:hypothetical protein
LRDIVEGEELYIDYGSEWQTAWEEHVSNYEHQFADLPVDARYLSAKNVNAIHGGAPLRTNKEQLVDPYPEHLSIRCHSNLLFDEHTSEFIWKLSEYGYHCDVLDRFCDTSQSHENTDCTRYEVRVFFQDDSDLTHVDIRGVVREAIAFIDQPCTTDVHIPHAFRHYVGLPDSMIPSSWRVDH